MATVPLWCSGEGVWGSTFVVPLLGKGMRGLGKGMGGRGGGRRELQTQWFKMGDRRALGMWSAGPPPKMFCYCKASQGGRWKCR